MSTEAADRRALAELLLRRERHADLDRARIPRRPHPDAPAPLSVPQHRIWLLEQLRPGTAAYNEPFAVRLLGRLDPHLVERCVRDIMRRHEVLRSAVLPRDGRPAQVALADPAPRFRAESVTALPPPEREAAALSLIRRHATQPFDLTRAPLFRVHLVRLVDDEHILAFTMHHLVSDGWSMRVLLHELVEGYAGHRSGAPPSLPELTIQYADYAQWQHDQLDGGRLADQLRYWRDQMRGAPAALELPADRPRPPVPTFAGAEHVFTLPRALVRRLEARAREEAATLFMVLLAAYQLLLARYSGQDDVVVGTPTANRVSTQTEPLIGCFVNTLPLRAGCDGAQPFRHLLRQVRDTVLAAFRQGELPFERLVEELSVPRDASRNPLFQVMFVLHNQPSAAEQPPDLVVRPVSGLSGTAKFDLTLAFVETDAGLRGHLEYSTDLFDAGTVARMAGHLRTLLESVADDPDRPAGLLPVLTAAEAVATRAQWQRPVAAPEPASLPDLFARQVARTPDTVAVVAGEVHLSYAELGRRADRLADRLRRHGVGPGTLVALCLERRAELVISVLAVLKAGGAYVPLDPDGPPERLRTVLASAAIPLLLTHQHLADRVPRTGGLTVIAVDHPVSGSTQEPAATSTRDGLPRPIRATDPAYVIFTSGSTGVPKGVQVEHGQVSRLFRATQGRFAFTPRDTWTLFHSYTFDVSVFELFGALLHGGRLVVVPRQATRSPRAFHRLLATEQVTVLSQTPTAFYGLIDADAGTADAGRLAALRLVLLAGERLDFARLATWFDHHPDTAPRVVNMLGATETTVHSTYRWVRRADTAAARSHVGEPLPDLRLLVVDGQLQPVPVGVPGELLVAGAGLARGYLGRPGLTAERFVPDPLGGPRRCYRTGDVVRRTASGDLEYLRRGDDQIKIRGFRVEPGEVEAVLRSHPGVAEAVVTPAPDPAGGTRLVAHVVGATDPPPGAASLRDHVRTRLPDYMQPAAYGHLAAVPLTAGGKIDRKALPPLRPDRIDLADAYVAPRTDLERLLARCFAGVLGVDRVGIDDNFFDLGGHSVLAIRAHRELRERDLDLDVIDMFQYPTVRSLARRLAGGQALPAALDQARGRAARRRAALGRPGAPREEQDG